MARDRDVAAFERRAQHYDSGWLARWHGEVLEATRNLAMHLSPEPERILDVGCGTGRLLAMLADAYPSGRLVGVDPAPAMLTAAATVAPQRCAFALAVAEALPVPGGVTDLLVSTTSFDHWHDQRAGLGECRRVLRPGGWMLLVDLCSPLLWPTTLIGRRGRARTPGQVRRLFAGAGFTDVEVRPVSWLIRATIAR